MKKELLMLNSANVNEKAKIGNSFRLELSNTEDLDMVWIEPGTFMMGSPEDEIDNSFHLQSC